MAIHSLPCKICDEIAQCEAGTAERLVAEMESGWVIMGELQPFEGYCILLAKHPVTEVFHLTDTQRDQFFRDLSNLAKAVSEVTNCHKVNCEILGNLEPHLHAHVFPRRLTDADPHQPVWGAITPDSLAFDSIKHDTMKKAIADSLTQ